MKNNNIIQINTTKTLDSKLDKALNACETKLPSSIFSNFKSVLDDEKNMINWNDEASSSINPGYKLIGSTYIKIPHFQIPSIPHALEELKVFKLKFEESFVPLKERKSGHLKLFEQEILLLVNCYPTYGKKDDNFKQEMITTFLVFFEEFPVATFSSAVRDWIKTEKKFPEVATLRNLIKKKLFIAQRKLNRLNKIIEKSS
jgi:hypothetical protein